MMDKETGDFMMKLMGLDPEVERARVKREFVDYSHLLATMNDEEFAQEIANEFGTNPRQTAIIAVLYMKVRGLC